MPVRTATARAADIEVKAQRLASVYGRTTPQRRFEGLLWYPQAYDIAASLVPHDPPRGAAVLAALSPRLGWDDNVADAWRIIRGASEGFRALPKSVARAWEVYNAPDPLAALSGPKVVAFAAAILGDMNAVPVDTWAARAALPAGDVRPINHIGRAERARIGAAYCLAGGRLALAPRDLQATLWLQTRTENVT